MSELAGRAQHLGHEATENDELGARSVVADNPNESPFGGGPSRPTA